MASNLVGAKLVRLAIRRNLDKSGGDLRAQPRSDGCSGRPPGLVAVQKQNDFMEVLLKKVLLLLGKRTPHESYNAGQACLVYVEAIEEPFDNDYSGAMKDSSVQVE
jgi:hypothetical protein